MPSLQEQMKDYNKGLTSGLICGVACGFMLGVTCMAIDMGVFSYQCNWSFGGKTTTITCDQNGNTTTITINSWW